MFKKAHSGKTEKYYDKDQPKKCARCGKQGWYQDRIGSELESMLAEAERRILIGKQPTTGNLIWYSEIRKQEVCLECSRKVIPGKGQTYKRTDPLGMLGKLTKEQRKLVWELDLVKRTLEKQKTEKENHEH